MQRLPAISLLVDGLWKQRCDYGNIQDHEASHRLEVSEAWSLSSMCYIHQALTK